MMGRWFYSTLMATAMMLGGANLQASKKADISTGMLMYEEQIKGVCGPEEIRHTPAVGYGHVQLERTEEGHVTLYDMSTPIEAYGTFDIIDAALPDGFFALMSVDGGAFFYVAEVIGWGLELPPGETRKSAVTFRDGAKIMELCHQSQ
ncbi:MAG: hypothetical protein HQL53_07390 [Magnetococcales bacterium]|nr:hypothetical protein [Magnetococcales bacterium]